MAQKKKKKKKLYGREMKHQMMRKMVPNKMMRKRETD